MKVRITYSIMALFVISLISLPACKDFRKFKESRAALNQKKQEAKEANEATEVIEDEAGPKTESENVNEEKEIIKDSLFFSYERTPCFGRCAIFKLKIYDSGRASYDGTNFVDNIGFFKSQLSIETLGEIESYLKEANFFWLEDTYDNKNVTDLPSRIIEVNKNGKYKKVIARYQFPEELKQLFIKLDNLFETIDWEPHSEN